MEMFRALLSPLKPHSPTLPRGTLEINYDAILPSSRRAHARSLPECRKAMATIRADLQAWGDRTRDARTTVVKSERGSGSDSPSKPDERVEDDGGINGVGPGVAGEVGIDGFAGELRREVNLVAITPTRQEVKSSVGREVSSKPHPEQGVSPCTRADRQLWFCALHAIHHFSMLRTIAVHELVS
jgi:hypothetical protein